MNRSGTGARRRCDRDRSGVTMTEIVIAVLVLSAALIPIYSTFISGSKAISNSRLAYMTSQVARETMEEIRQVPVERLEEYVRDYNEAWAAMGANADPNVRKLFRLTAKYRSRDEITDDPKNVLETSPSYPEEYQRIRPRLEVQDVGTSGVQKVLKKVTLELTWQETGGRNEKTRTGISRFTTLVGYHSVDPEIADPSVLLPPPTP